MVVIDAGQQIGRPQSSRRQTSPTGDRYGHGGDPEAERLQVSSQRGFVMANTHTSAHIRPFTVDVPEEKLADLRRRITATQWPEKETVADQSQGVPLGMMQELAGYWATEYDWRRCEGTLNALPHFITE